MKCGAFTYRALENEMAEAQVRKIARDEWVKLGGGAGGETRLGLGKGGAGGGEGGGHHRGPAAPELRYA